MPYKIVLAKENFKFSCSHFTIFATEGAGPNTDPAIHAERLHGHNYYVSVEIEIANTIADRGYGFDFNAVKPMVREITAHFDEYVLLPENSAHLKIVSSIDSVRAQFLNKHYVFPVEDVRLLPVVNVTSEELARLIHSRLSGRLTTLLDPRVGIEMLTVGVEETRGQSVHYTSRPTRS